MLGLSLNCCQLPCLKACTLMASYHTRAPTHFLSIPTISVTTYHLSTPFTRRTPIPPGLNCNQSHLDICGYGKGQFIKIYFLQYMCTHTSQKYIWMWVQKRRKGNLNLYFTVYHCNETPFTWTISWPPLPRTIYYLKALLSDEWYAKSCLHPLLSVITHIYHQLLHNQAS